MSWLDLFRRPRGGSADTAKERLQILLAHERIDRDGPDYLPILQKELLGVITKYLAVDNDKVEVRLERGRDHSTLEVNIELPGAAKLNERFRRPSGFGTAVATG
jgi:cell division topological specificity factor